MLADLQFFPRVPYQTGHSTDAPSSLQRLRDYGFDRQLHAAPGHRADGLNHGYPPSSPPLFYNGSHYRWVPPFENSHPPTDDYAHEPHVDVFDVQYEPYADMGKAMFPTAYDRTEGLVHAECNF